MAIVNGAALSVHEFSVAVAVPNSKGSNVHCIDLPTTLESEPMRNLATEFAQIYAARCNASEKFDPSLVLKLSQSYRTVIRETLLNAELPEDAQKCLSVVDVCWSLAEAIFFFPTRQLSVVLMEWVQENSSLTPEDYAEALADASLGGTFWKTLYKLLLRGFFVQAISLLARVGDHAGFSQDRTVVGLCQDIITLLKQSPLLRADRLSAVEFGTYCQMWRQSFRELRVVAEASGQGELVTVCGLCGGDRATLNTIIKENHTSEWYEGVVSYLIFVEPHLSRHELPDLVSDVLPQASDIKDPFSKLVLALFSQDTLELTFNICTLFPDECTALHVIDLLALLGLRLDSSLAENTTEVTSSNILDHLIEEYAIKLMHNRYLWQLGFLYWPRLGDQGVLRLHEFIDSIPCDCDDDAVDIMEVCAKEGFHGKALAVCRKRAMHYLQVDDLKSASVWAARSEDPSVLCQIAERYLKSHYAGQNLPEYDQLRLLLETCNITSPRFKLFCKYVQFKKHLDIDEMSEAVEILKEMLMCKRSAFYKHLRLCILIDGVTLLDRGLIDYGGCSMLHELYCTIESDVTVSNFMEEEYARDLLETASKAINDNFIRTATNCWVEMK